MSATASWHASGQQNAEREHHRERPVIHHPAERPRVRGQPALIHALGRLIPPPVLLFFWRSQKAAAQHRRQRQGDEAGDENRHADRHGKFVEQAAQDTAHQQDGNEDRGQ